MPESVFRIALNQYWIGSPLRIRIQEQWRWQKGNFVYGSRFPKKCLFHLPSNRVMSSPFLHKTIFFSEFCLGDLMLYGVCCYFIQLKKVLDVGPFWLLPISSPLLKNVRMTTLPTSRVKSSLRYIHVIVTTLVSLYYWSIQRISAPGAQVVFFSLLMYLLFLCRGT
jgi:hypothetical protein